MKRRFRGAGAPRTAGLSLWFFIVTLLLAIHADKVAAHALVIASQPAANGEVAAGAVVVDLRFNSRLDRKRARLRLVNGAGEARDLLLVDDDSPDHLRAAAGTLGAGDYRIEWYVLSPDGHVTRGNVPFKVQAKAPDPVHAP
jgi:hypothetical protein